MNHNLLPKPRFWAEAGLQKQTKFSLFAELLFFMLVYLIADLIRSFLASAVVTFYVFSTSGEGIYQYYENGTIDIMGTVMHLIDSPPAWLVAVMLLASAAFFGAAVFYCLKIEKRKLSTMGLCGKNPLGEYLLGSCIGFFMFAAVLGIGVGAGGFRIVGWSFSSAALPLMLLFALGFAVQGAAEELMVRGYLATSLGSRLPVPLALLTSSLVFSVLHAGNVSFDLLASLNILLIGLVLCVFMIKRGSIWGAFAIHSMWNFTQGCVFGLPVSGFTTESAMVEVRTEGYRSTITGGAFGPEASICTTIVLLAALGAMLALKAKDPAPAKVQDGIPEDRQNIL